MDKEWRMTIETEILTFCNFKLMGSSVDKGVLPRTLIICKAMSGAYDEQSLSNHTYRSF
jgi:hypothetical protein